MPEPTILYIEDEQENLTLIRLFLRKEPFQLLTAETPEKALQILESHKVDLVLVDLNLQGEGDGAILVKAIRDNPKYKTTPVFVFSGFDEYQLQKHGIDGMVQKFFRKPTSKQVLVQALNEQFQT